MQNSYNSPPNDNHNPLERAVAALIQGDKSAFYNCGFLGLQDTLWDVEGRHYFKSCTIEGAIDFIFGAGQSLFEVYIYIIFQIYMIHHLYIYLQGCSISVAAGALHGSPGYITAHGRVNPEDRSGFVFKDCSIAGTGKAYLGRPWRDYARVVFYNTRMSGIVVPQGWDAWKSAGKEWDFTPSHLFVVYMCMYVCMYLMKSWNWIFFFFFYRKLLALSEYNSHGSGAERGERVKWAKKLSEGEVKQFASISFIDDQGWVNQAVNIFSSWLLPFFFLFFFWGTCNWRVLNLIKYFNAWLFRQCI